MRRVRLGTGLLAVAFAVATLAASTPAAGHASNVAGSLGSQRLAPGDTFQLSLDGPGIYDVHCHYHANMTGRLVVHAGTAPEGPRLHRVTLRDGAGPAGGSFVDEDSGTATTTAYAGDLIVWTNAGNQTHDVHLSPAIAVDNGSFETVVLVGLAASLVLVFAISRR